MVAIKIIRIAVGLLLTLFGVNVCFGTGLSLVEGKSHYSLATDITGLVLIGMIPLLLGVGLLSTGIVRLFATDSRKVRATNMTPNNALSLGC